jgi:hypothetical protein
MAAEVQEFEAKNTMRCGASCGRAQRVEVGDAILTLDNDFAIDQGGAPIALFLPIW